MEKDVVRLSTGPYVDVPVRSKAFKEFGKDDLALSMALAEAGAVAEGKIGPRRGQFVVIWALDVDACNTSRRLRALKGTVDRRIMGFAPRKEEMVLL